MQRINRPYVGIPTFLRAKAVRDISTLEASVAVLGVPFDEGSPFLPGSRMAPRALREHSMRFAGRNGIYDVDARKEYLQHEMAHELIADVGDIDVHPTNPRRTFELVTDTVRMIIGHGALPVVLGGDHSISFAVVSAFDEPIHVLQFDAHTDYAPITPDLQFTNGHAFRHIGTMSQVTGLTQIGIRSLRTSPDQIRDILSDGHRVITMGEFSGMQPHDVAAGLPEGTRCYVSIDVDALDMSLVPGCVSGEPNGMTYAQLRDALRAIAERLDVVGFDFVEVNPMLDVQTGATSYLGAHAVIEFLGHICAQPRWAERQKKKRRACDGRGLNEGQSRSTS
jgi:agmatinase